MKTWILGILFCTRLLMPVSDTDLSGYDFSEIQAQIDETEGDVSFVQVLDALLGGNWKGAVELMGDLIRSSLFGELSQARIWMLELISVAVVGGVFAQFAGIIKNAGVAQIAGYLMDILFVTLLFTCFSDASRIAEEYMFRITEFTKALVPAFGTAMALTGKFGMAALSGELLLFAATLMEWVAVHLLLPGIKLYLLLTFLNQLTSEDLFGKLQELLKSGLDLGMKTLFGLLLGLQIVQGIILPAADSGKYHLGQRLIGLIPGIGSSAQMVLNTTMGSAILVKNCIGGAGMLFIAVLTLIPCGKLLLLSAGYQLTAGITQPVSDQAMTEMASGTAAAVGLLAKAVALSGFLFFLSLAAISVTSGTDVLQ